MKFLPVSCLMTGLLALSGCGKPATQPSTTPNIGATQPSVNPPHDPIQSPIPQSPQKPTVAQKSRFKASATDLMDEYLSDPDEFKKKYIDQTVEITGVVTGFDDDILGDSFIHIESDRPKGHAALLCHVAFKAWNEALPGQTVRLSGRYYNDFVNNIRFEPCVLLEVNGEPPPSFTPDEFAKQIDVHLEAAKKNFDKNKGSAKGIYIIVEGTVQKVSLKNDPNYGQIEFESKQDGIKIVVKFGQSDFGNFKSFKPGQKVRLLTTLYGYQDKNKVELNNPKILSNKN